MKSCEIAGFSSFSFPCGSVISVYSVVLAGQPPNILNAPKVRNDQYQSMIVRPDRLAYNVETQSIAYE
jgi:hypothetical protein